MTREDEEGRWDVHFFPCGWGCHHLTQVDLADSRAGFQAHVEHLKRCCGWSRLNATDPDLGKILHAAQSSTPITERVARTRFEERCPLSEGWDKEWHAPHEWMKPGEGRKMRVCYGWGSLRQVPELPKGYYFPES